MGKLGTCPGALGQKRALHDPSFYFYFFPELHEVMIHPVREMAVITEPVRHPCSLLGWISPNSSFDR